MVAVQFAGQAVVARQIGEAALVLVALVDDAQDAVGAERLAFGADEPAPGILDPKLGFGRRIGTDAILNLIGDAVSVVVLVRLHDGVEPGLCVIGVKELRIAAAGRNRSDVADEQHDGGVGAPNQDVAVEPPLVGYLADGRQNLRGIERRRRARRRARRPRGLVAGDRISRTGVVQIGLFGICRAAQRKPLPLWRKAIGGA